MLAQFEAMAALIKEARRPLTGTEMRDIARQIELRLLRWVQMGRWAIAIGVALVLALPGAGIAGGFGWSESRKGMVAATNCEPFAMLAGEVARRLFWVRLPPP